MPSTYQHCYTISPGQNRLAQLLIILAAFGAFFIAWQLIQWFSPALLRPVSGGIVLIDRYGILIVVVAMIFFHENIHALVAWRFTNHWPSYGVAPLGIYINTAGWYFPRSIMIAISIAPFLLLTLLGFLLLVILPSAFLHLAVWFLLLNGVGSINDMAVTTWILFQPDSALIQNNGREISIYRAEEVDLTLTLRDRIRLFLELYFPLTNREDYEGNRPKPR
jgi:hypothetical protein